MSISRMRRQQRDMDDVEDDEDDLLASTDIRQGRERGGRPLRPNSSGHSLGSRNRDSRGYASLDAGGNSLYAELPAPSRNTTVCLECRNERLLTALRVMQLELTATGGPNTQTRIEVFDLSFSRPIVIFTVKHTHGNVWGREMVVHKNLLVAGAIAGVPPPMDIPADSKRMYEQTDNAQHMHMYMERVMPHVRYERMPEGVILFWWRPVGNGSVVLMNSASGKLVLVKNKTRTIPGAVEALSRIIELLRSLNSTSSFLEPDPMYPLELEEGEVADPSEEGDPQMILEQVQQWALNDLVSPWMTDLIIRTQGMRRSQITDVRYSLGVELAQDDGLPELDIHVHSNEPLSRELDAFPVCSVPMAMPSMRLGDVRIAYRQCLWFLRKLYDIHMDAEVNNKQGQARVGGRRPGEVSSPRGQQSSAVPFKGRPNGQSVVSRASLGAARQLGRRDGSAVYMQRPRTPDVALAGRRSHTAMSQRSTTPTRVSDAGFARPRNVTPTRMACPNRRSPSVPRSPFGTPRPSNPSPSQDGRTPVGRNSSRSRRASQTSDGYSVQRQGLKFAPLLGDSHCQLRPPVTRA